MGNRAVIVHESVTKENANNKVGIYLHWYGSEDDIQRFLDEAKNRKIRSFDDSYGMARLIQAIGDILTEDCMKSELSTVKDNPYETGLGVDIVSRLDCHNYDNGVWKIDNDYNIVEHTDGSEFD